MLNSLFPVNKFIAYAGDEPVTLMEAKSYIRVDDDDDDFIIKNIIKSVREISEKYLKKTIRLSKFSYYRKNNFGNCLKLPSAPIEKIEEIYCHKSVIYKSPLNKDLYHILDDDKIIFKNKPEGNALDIHYIAGFDTDKLPAALKQAMLIHIAHIYETRCLNNDIPKSSLQLYRPFQLLRV